MQHILSPQCPHCAERVALLSPPWQAQRGSRTRVCPFCGGRVEPKFKAIVYASWFAALLASAALAGFLFGPKGFSVFFVAAFLVPLLPSIYLANAA